MLIKIAGEQLPPAPIACMPKGSSGVHNAKSAISRQQLALGNYG
jgi:hypothetical protein